MLATLLAVSLMAGTSQGPAISDRALVQYVLHVRRTHAWPQGGFIGIHHGARVIADIRCGDLCPQETRMVIHYTIAPGPECIRIGGSEVEALMPFAIAVRKERFCVPRILARKDLFSAP